MKLNKIIACGLLFGGLSVLVGCGDDEKYDVDGIAYTRAFFDRAGSVTDGSVLSTPIGTVVSLSDAISVKTTSPVPATTQVTISVDNSLVSAYNDNHGTNYSQLPDGILKMDKSFLTIPANAYQSDVLNLTIDKEAAEVLDNIDGYLAPIIIESVDNRDIRPSSNAAVRYVHINYMKTNSLINDNASAFAGTKVDISSLTCIAATNLNPDEISGLAGSSWNARWPFISDVETEASFTIDLNEVRSVAGFYIDSYVISNAYVEISTDNSTWTELGNTSEHQALQAYDNTTYTYNREFVLYAPVQARYLRAKLTLDSSGWAWSYYRHISELSIYCM